MSERPTRVVAVRLPRPAPVRYQVHIGPEGPSALADFLSDTFGDARIAIITEEALTRLSRRLAEALEERGMDTESLTFGGGEERKTRSQKRDLEDALLDAGFGRDTVLAAVGGGVTCDLAGFVAATYHRGVPWVALPTTLLAMVDASIGGKVGVNTAHGKNLIGAFHHPSRVHCDPDLLSSLPEREMRSGLAEVAKAALLEGEVRMARLRKLAPLLLGGVDPAARRDALMETLEAAIQRKVAVVSRDEQERDYRQVLNAGHTIGHALEASSGFQLRHGEALAVGLALEARLAHAAGIASRNLYREVESLLEALGLSTDLPDGLDPLDVHERLVRDKKVRGGRVRFALLEAPGKPHEGTEGWAVAVDDALVRRILSVP